MKEKNLRIKKVRHYKMQTTTYNAVRYPPQSTIQVENGRMPWKTHQWLGKTPSSSMKRGEKIGNGGV